MDRSTTDHKPAPTRPADAASDSTVELRIDVPTEVGRRLHRVANREHISESSIVAVALHLIFSRLTDGALGHMLRDYRASLKRAH